MNVWWYAGASVVSPSLDATMARYFAMCRRLAAMSPDELQALKERTDAALAPVLERENRCTKVNHADRS